MLDRPWHLRQCCIKDVLFLLDLSWTNGLALSNCNKTDKWCGNTTYNLGCPNMATCFGFRLKVDWFDACQKVTRRKHIHMSALTCLTTLVSCLSRKGMDKTKRNTSSFIKTKKKICFWGRSCLLFAYYQVATFVHLWGCETAAHHRLVCWRTTCDRTTSVHCKFMTGRHLDYLGEFPSTGLCGPKIFDQSGRYHS
jgi:hypothetical protein